MNYQTAFEMLRGMVNNEYKKANRALNSHPSPFGGVASGEYQRGRLNVAADIYNESSRLLRHIGGGQ